jgi:hypothetical protein
VVGFLNKNLKPCLGKTSEISSICWVLLPNNSVLFDRESQRSWRLDRNAIKKISLISILVFFTSLFSPGHANAWELSSENTRSGIIASAVEFWVDGYGPVTSKQFFNGTFENDTYWSSLILMCEKKKLTIYMNLEMTGSGHDDFRLDDPGYVLIGFNNSATKRYRTYATGVAGTIAVQKDAVALAKAMLSKQTLSSSFKLRFGKRIPVKYSVAGLAKAKTRFKYAGCAF